MTSSGGHSSESRISGIVTLCMREIVIFKLADSRCGGIAAKKKRFGDPSDLGQFFFQQLLVIQVSVVAVQGEEFVVRA